METYNAGGKLPLSGFFLNGFDYSLVPYVHAVKVSYGGGRACLYRLVRIYNYFHVSEFATAAHLLYTITYRTLHHNCSKVKRLKGLIPVESIRQMDDTRMYSRTAGLRFPTR